MTFALRGLSCIGDEAALPGCRVWNYITTDAANTIDTADYFLSAINQLELGDIIEVIIVTGSITAPSGLTSRNRCYVNGKSATSIDVTDLVALASTDSR